MPLGPGSHLGPYEVLALIGAGGMGEVYRARDPRLGREVAIKVLPHDRVADESRRQRFIQEAKAASSLNHPHIITIYEIESADGIDFLVMEYVRGKSLDALIPRQGMRLGEVLRIAISVADALAAAHARGIVHRDLKPANVMVGTDGAVKVLDFGLAKLTTEEGTPEDETATVVAEPSLSTPGMIIGTAAYMSPEQATGGTVDARSDIFSFGAMLYEMVTGVRAFAGSSTGDTLAAVVRAQPTRPTEVVPHVPADLEKVILRCLRKEPARRFQHMVDVKVELQEIKDDSESGPSAELPLTRDTRRRTRLTISAVTATIVVILGAAAWLLVRPHGEASLRIVPLTVLKGTEYAPTFSPDGEQVAFSWNSEKEDNYDIYAKFVGSVEVRRLTTNPAPDGVPRWSPDGRQIAFRRTVAGRSTIHLVSPLTGTERAISDFPSIAAIDWSRDGRWIATAHDADPSTGADVSGIYLIPVEGGDPRLILPSSSMLLSSPAFSPDSRQLAYTSCVLQGCAPYVVDLDGALTPAAPPRQLAPPAGIGSRSSSIAWTRDGRSIIYGLYGGSFLTYLWRVAVDGSRQPERIEVAGLGATSPAIAISRDRLAFARSEGDVDLYRFVAGHAPEAVAASNAAEMEAALSGTGRVAFTSARSGDALRIWVADIDGSRAQQLTSRGVGQGSPSWSPDGRTIAFDADDGSHSHIWTIDADGANMRQVSMDGGDQNLPAWSQDGQWIYFSWDQGTGRDIWRTHPAGGVKERITQGGSGLVGRESLGGRSVFYQPTDGDSPLFEVALGGGTPHQVIGCVASTAFAVTAKGIYYVPCHVESEDAPVRVTDPVRGTDRLFGTLDKYSSYNVAIFTVSPDGNTLMYGRNVVEGADLMLIENFR